MKTLTRHMILLLVMLICLPALTVQAAKLHKKWEDENGQFRYGDSIPPEYAQEGNESLNSQGIVVERTEAAKTPEQIDEERIRKEKADQDRILLQSFANEDEMVRTRDGNIALIEARIRVTQEHGERLEQRLAALEVNAANLERIGKLVPAPLKTKIEKLRQQIAQNQRDIEDRKAEQGQIREQFERDIQRIRKLNTPEAATPAEQDSLIADQRTNTLVDKQLDQHGLLGIGGDQP